MGLKQVCCNYGGMYCVTRQWFWLLVGGLWLQFELDLWWRWQVCGQSFRLWYSNGVDSVALVLENLWQLGLLVVVIGLLQCRYAGGDYAGHDWALRLELLVFFIFPKDNWRKMNGTRNKSDFDPQFLLFDGFRL